MLLGDAAHPPVPYIGQGAMMAMEDVGVLSHLLRHFCCAAGAAPFAPSDANLAAAAESYQAMRIARTKRILGSSSMVKGAVLVRPWLATGSSSGCI